MRIVRHSIMIQTLILPILFATTIIAHGVEFPQQVKIRIVRLFNGQSYAEKQPNYFQAEIESDFLQIPSDYVLWVGIERGTELINKKFKGVIFGNGDKSVSLSVEKDTNLFFNIPVELHFDLDEPYIELSTSFAIDDEVKGWGRDVVEYVKLALFYDLLKWEAPHFKWCIKDPKSGKWAETISNATVTAVEFLDPERSETELRFNDTDQKHLELLPYGSYEIRCKITDGNTGRSKIVYTTLNFVKEKEHFIQLEYQVQGKQMTFDIGPRISCGVTYEQIKQQAWSFNITKTETWSEEIGVAVEAGIEYLKASLSRQLQHEVSVSKSEGISISVGHNFQWNPASHEPFKNWLQRPSAKEVLKKYIPNINALSPNEFQEQITRVAKDHYCEYLMQPTVTVPTRKYVYRLLYIGSNNDIKKGDRFVLFVPTPPMTEWVYDYKYCPRSYSAH